MDASVGNPLAELAYISAPAVLTNASCVLLFGAGNRYARAVDRLHELAKVVAATVSLETEEATLRIVQLQAAEDRALFIVRALTCFYGAVAAFVASTLFGLLGGIAAKSWPEFGGHFVLVVALISGAVGVAAMITGALLLVRETRASFAVLLQEKTLITNQLKRRMGEPSRS